MPSLLHPQMLKKIVKMLNEIEKSPAKAGMVEVFNFSQERSPVRVRLIYGEPWFVATDVCQILGISNNRDAISRLDDDEKKDGVGITDTVGRKNRMSVVSESGLYRLIFQSRKPEACKFRKWVTGEVLPSIRRKGFYGARKHSADYVDARDVPFMLAEFRGKDVRVVEIDGELWYSLNDIHAGMGSRTESSQSARRLNARQELARKIWIFGVPNPGWFVKELGVRLLLCSGKRGGDLQHQMLVLDRKEAHS